MNRNYWALEEGWPLSTPCSLVYNLIFGQKPLKITAETQMPLNWDETYLLKKLPICYVDCNKTVSDVIFA